MCHVGWSETGNRPNLGPWQIWKTGCICKLFWYFWGHLKSCSFSLVFFFQIVATLLHTGHLHPHCCRHKVKNINIIFNCTPSDHPIDTDIMQMNYKPDSRLTWNLTCSLEILYISTYEIWKYFVTNGTKSHRFSVKHTYIERKCQMTDKGSTVKKTWV